MTSHLPNDPWGTHGKLAVEGVRNHEVALCAH